MRNIITQYYSTDSGGENSVFLSRKSYRVIQPSLNTGESYVSNVLTITVTLDKSDLDLLSVVPVGGTDILVVNYQVDSNVETLFFAPTFWATDAGWCFIGTDSVQYLISGVNGSFFDFYATAINFRNTSNAVPTLLPCSTPARYGYIELLPGQLQPKTWILDGVTQTSTRIY